MENINSRVAASKAIAAGKAHESGFSLIEVMVGMALGLATVVIIMQSLIAFEAQKKITIGGSDAHENGLFALHEMETEIHMAGAGLITAAGLSCSTMNWYYNGATGSSPIAPIIIQNGVGGKPDSVLVSYSNSIFSSSPAMLLTEMPTSDASIGVDAISMAGFMVNKDKMIIATPSFSNGGVACSRLAYVDTTVSPSPGDLSLINPPPTTNIFPTASNGYNGFESFAINMGDFIQSKYSISGTDIVVADDSIPLSPKIPVSNNVVSIQAQYGVAPQNTSLGSSSPAVNCWTDAAGATCSPSSGDWAAPSSTDIMRIKAVRLAIVARSSAKERVSGNCSTTTSAPLSWIGGPTIDLSNDPDWKCYRYSVFQSIIPLRNVIWGNV